MLFVVVLYAMLISNPFRNILHKLLNKRHSAKAWIHDFGVT